jgi:hypothetical protein
LSDGALTNDQRRGSYYRWMRSYWFWAWCFAGVLTFTAFAFLASIGILILPFAVFAAILLARRAPIWPDAIGFIGGFGLSIALFGVIALTLVTGADTSTSPGPIPLLLSGLLVAAAATATFVVARR